MFLQIITEKEQVTHWFFMELWKSRMCEIVKHTFSYNLKKIFFLQSCYMRYETKTVDAEKNNRPVQRLLCVKELYTGFGNLNQARSKHLKSTPLLSNSQGCVEECELDVFSLDWTGFGVPPRILLSCSYARRKYAIPHRKPR